MEYFISLCDLSLPPLLEFKVDLEKKAEILRSIYKNLTIEDAEKIKAFERITNHDVKAVEYFLKEKYVGLYPLSSSLIISKV